MSSDASIPSEPIAVRHRATSAQPPHATSIFYLWPSSRRAPQPFPSTAILATPCVLLKGLRRYPAAYPLPKTIEGEGKNVAAFLGNFR